MNAKNLVPKPKTNLAQVRVDETRGRVSFHGDEKTAALVRKQGLGGLVRMGDTDKWLLAVSPRFDAFEVGMWIESLEEDPELPGPEAKD